MWYILWYIWIYNSTSRKNLHAHVPRQATFKGITSLFYHLILCNLSSMLYHISKNIHLYLSFMSLIFIFQFVKHKTITYINTDRLTSNSSSMIIFIDFLSTFTEISKCIVFQQIKYGEKRLYKSNEHFVRFKSGFWTEISFNLHMIAAIFFSFLNLNFFNLSTTSWGTSHTWTFCAWKIQS